MNSNWYIFNKKKNVEIIKQKYGISYLTSVILCNRDIYRDEDIKMIFSSNIDDLNSYNLLPDVDKGIEILHEYVNDNKNIRIVGDYDIDGICSTFILYDTIKKLGAKVSFDIPDRILDGYGINDSIIKKAVDDKIDLIITCDNGIAAEEQIKLASLNNIKVIVTDHHDISSIPKSASAVVNPKRNDNNFNYPFKEISGAVVAWKFMTKYYDKYKNDAKFVIDNYLEFAMISTVGDIMPLVNENHLIVKLGLKKIKNTNNIGLKKLLNISEIDYLNKDITTYHIGFIIGPLINAAGRMDSASLAMKLFISEDDSTANTIALKLKSLNDLRKKLTDDGYIKAESLIENKYKKDKVLLVYVEGLCEQVAGIVAGRIKEEYFKPCIILTDTIEKGIYKASCRSIENYDIFSALNKHNDLFLKFGGHKLAAGFSIEAKHVDKLRDLLNEECLLEEKDFVPKIQIDLENPFYSFNIDVIKEIECLQPFGQGFKKPIFATKNVNAEIKNIYGESKNIIQLFLYKDNKKCRSVAFIDSKRLIERLSKSDLIDILYYPRINEFRGEQNVEINLIDYR